MNAITKTKELSEAQSQRLTQILSQAVVGLKSRSLERDGYEPSEDQINNFKTNLTPEITASILKASDRTSTVGRDARLSAVKALAAANGVKFIHRRELEEFEKLADVEVISRNYHIETIEVDTVNATRGGQTIAFTYVLDEDNKLSIDYSVAFCRDDENFDPLIGMEISIEKFLAGYTTATPIAHERFGEVKLHQLAVAYKTFENNL